MNLVNYHILVVVLTKSATAWIYVISVNFNENGFFSKKQIQANPFHAKDGYVCPANYCLIN